jgi:hypothetical protein
MGPPAMRNAHPSLAAPIVLPRWPTGLRARGWEQHGTLLDLEGRGSSSRAGESAGGGPIFFRPAPGPNRAAGTTRRALCSQY